LLPFQVGRVVVERAPRSFKVINLHEQKQILISPEDGMLGDPDFFQFGKAGQTFRCAAPYSASLPALIRN